jgi:hypothetical protein
MLLPFAGKPNLLSLCREWDLYFWYTNTVTGAAIHISCGKLFELLSENAYTHWFFCLNLIFFWRPVASRGDYDAIVYQRMDLSTIRRHLEVRVSLMNELCKPWSSSMLWSNLHLLIAGLFCKKLHLSLPKFRVLFNLSTCLRLALVAFLWAHPNALFSNSCCLLSGMIWIFILVCYWSWNVGFWSTNVYGIGEQNELTYSISDMHRDLILTVTNALVRVSVPLSS